MKRSCYGPRSIDTRARFLQGGPLTTGNYGLNFPKARSYNAQLFVDLLRDDYEREKKILRNAHLMAFIRAIPELEHSWRQALETLEENAFFGFRGGDIYYTDRFFRGLSLSAWLYPSRSVGVGPVCSGKSRTSGFSSRPQRGVT